MTFDNALGLIISVGLTVYLLIALLFPERL
jgi:K+-transporting ATPase KdpF subunit